MRRVVFGIGSKRQASVAVGYMASDEKRLASDFAILNHEERFIALVNLLKIAALKVHEAQ